MDVALGLVPFALLGFLFGIIFVSDGWLSSKASEQSLSKSPKIRGLIYILGAGVIPLVTDLSKASNINNSSAVSVYTLFVSTSIFISLLILNIYAFLVSFKRLRRINRSEAYWEIAIESFTFVSIAFHEGSRKFKEEIDNRLINEIIKQKDNAIEFLGTAFDDLIKLNVQNKEGYNEFEEFIQHYLERFLQIFLDTSIGRYRASIYYLDKAKNEFLFFTGVSPQTAPHTQQPLPVQTSLAGYAVEHPYIAHFCAVDDRRESSLPFHRRESPERYKSVVVCAIKPIFDESNYPKMVLCLDCVDSRASAFGDYEYLARMVVLLSILFADAQASMKISDEVIRNDIRN